MQGIKRRRISSRLFKIIENKLATEGIAQFDYAVLNEGYHQQQTEDHTSDDSSWIVADVRDLYDDDDYLIP